MPFLSWLRAFAGLTSLSLALVFLFSVFRFVASAWALPIPNLQFSIANVTDAVSRGVATHVLNVKSGEARLVVDKIKLDAPIQRDVPLTDEKAYDQALENGVALARGSADIESPTGNSFFFGHSSRSLLSWHITPFDTIFAGIPRLQPEDIVKVVEGSQTYTYKVTTSQSIPATDLSFVRPSQNRLLTMVTCWPLGWSESRWVVQAEKVQ